MTAVVNFIDEAMENAWLVPTTSIQQGDDNTFTVIVYRNDKPLTIAVEPDLAQGEWTVVHSPDLQDGDEVDAELSSFLNEGFFFEGDMPPEEEWVEEY
jgi:multidrug efflux pump subunit AcrA (membrane-fusion protein)